MTIKEVRFSDHAQLKIDVLAGHEIVIDTNFVIGTVRSPDRLVPGGKDKLIAQKRLDDNLLLRVVYREFNAFILIITIYPAKRSRYEKD
jgi:hypothetical protein